jgi:hypothetical protein
MSTSPYWEWDALQGVYLEDSYVLSITEEPAKLVFVMLLVLTEQHPAYRPPAAGEQYCYRRGAISFEEVTGVSWLSRIMRPILDVDGEVDYGNIDALYRTDGRYELEGEWGSLNVVARRVSLDIEPE